MFLNGRGFNFIEVIITIVIISIIAMGFSSLFSVVLDTPLMVNRRTAYMYAQQEMEKLFNAPFDSIDTVTKTNYPDDTEFDYEILVNEPQPEFKTVRINFYSAGSNFKVAELYTILIPKITISVCDDFENNGDQFPPWDWNPIPENRWQVVGDPITPGNKVYRFRRQGYGISYPLSVSGSDYKVSCKFFLRANSSGDSIVYLGARVNPNTGYGYYVRIDARVIIFRRLKFVTYQPKLVKIDASGEITLSTLPSSFEFINGNYTRVHEIGMKLDGADISFFFDSETGSASDSQFLSGDIMLKGYNEQDNLYIYFDDACMEER